MSKPVVVYTYAKCSTCRDAAAWLREQGIPFEERPIYERPPSLAELKRMLGFYGGQIRRLFNTSGLEYKARNLKEKLPAMTEQEALSLLSTNGRLVKRPFLLGADFGLVGFDPEAWKSALNRG
jgi:arsenate reductase